MCRKNKQLSPAVSDDDDDRDDNL